MNSCRNESSYSSVLLVFISFWKYFCACVRIWTTVRVLIKSAICFHCFLYNFSPSKNNWCSSGVHLPKVLSKIVFSTIYAGDGELFCTDLSYSLFLCDFPSKQKMEHHHDYEMVILGPQLMINQYDAAYSGEY